MRWRSTVGVVCAERVIPVDVDTRDGAEWFVLEDGRRIRLDRLLEVDGVAFASGGCGS